MLPQLLLCCGSVQSVLQLGLKGLQLLCQVPALFLSLGARLPLQLQILLQLRDLSLQLPDLLLGCILGCSLFLDPEGETTRGVERDEVLCDE